MASQVIITDLFRASHVHLKEKKAFQQGDKPSIVTGKQIGRAHV